jgi:signal transduction histidine kinase
MTRRLSLRSRLAAGAALWTAGLFVVSGIGATAMMMHYPEGPRIFHSMFAHRMLSTAIAVVCMVWGLLQVRKGFAPIDHLRTRLARVRAGEQARVEGHYPAEVQPLVDDLNALLEHRDRAVGRAQAKAGDLAHGLKTPLAVLAQEAGRAEAAGHHDLAAVIDQQVERMRRQMDYHLAHARAAASGGANTAPCPVRPVAEALARTLLRLHADRGLTIDVRVGADQTARVQRADLEEMLGNLLDNACKWTRAQIAIDSTQQNGRVIVTVDDDGPGVAAAMRDQVLRRGVRADETAAGSGFGLAIVRELAELYNGSIGLSTAPSGGLRARLELPA